MIKKTTSYKKLHAFYCNKNSSAYVLNNAKWGGVKYFLLFSQKGVMFQVQPLSYLQADKTSVVFLLKS